MSPHSHPDDSSLAEVSTLPRGQVDYLSHEWIEEEDVWRSWRNMTKQKKAIANGIRLENASWRTWWKQRNKLKTVTPETLNWLKDSDVTWLYGPLHTAVVWTAPPQPKPDPTSVEKEKSAHDRLDLSEISPNYHKPILKHRSISDMLTSELLPSSPLFNSAPSQQHHHTAPSSRAHSPGADELHVIMEEDEPDILPRRPGLFRARSENHVAPARPYSATNLNGYFSAHINANTSRRGGSPNVDAQDTGHGLTPPYEHPTSTSGTSTPAVGGNKKKHISFNTFVEQCIAIDKPETAVSSASGSSSSSLYDYWSPGNINDRGVMGGRSGKTSARGVKWGYDAGFDEDSSDAYDSDVPVPELGPNTEVRSVWDGVESAIESDSDDDTLQIQIKRTSSSTSLNTATNKRQKRSASKSSNSSASTSSGSSSGSSVPAVRVPRTRRNSSHQLLIEHSILPSAPKEHLLHNRKRQNSLPVTSPHVTIAPIAPTTLKTTGVGNGWTGDNYAYSAYGGGARSYGAVFSDDEDDDPGVVIGRVVHPQAARDVPHEGTPVELVYLPTVGSQYTRKVVLEDDSSDEDNEAEDPDTVYHYYSPQGSSGDLQALRSEPIPVAVARTPPTASNLGTNPTAIPIVDQGVFTEDAESSAYDYFEGPDLGSGVEFTRRMRQQNGRARTDGANQLSPPQSVSNDDGGLRLGLGPALVRYSQGGPSPTFSASPPSKSSPHSSVLLSPPTRGRGSADSSSSSSQSRGRSATRTSSASNSLSRERSSHSSSLGSLSPDGGPTYGAYGANTGRIVRDYESRDERAERKLRERQFRSASTSPESDEAENSDKSSLTASNSSSSSSSTVTVIPQVPIPMTLPSPNKTPTPSEPTTPTTSEPIRFSRAEEESQRSLHPTPSNSPVIHIAPMMKQQQTRPKFNGTSSTLSPSTPPVATTSASISMPRQGAEAALGKTVGSFPRQSSHRRYDDSPRELNEGGTLLRAVGMASALMNNLWSSGNNNTATASSSSP